MDDKFAVWERVLIRGAGLVLLAITVWKIIFAELAAF